MTPSIVQAKALSCPNCGGSVELRGFSHTLTVVCPQCLSVLDATSPELQILQSFQAKQRVQPKIPLGSRGKIGGIDYEVIGFQVREVDTDGDVYGWGEYLLFNPYQGFRYLSEYNGHWNFIRVLSALPEIGAGAGGRRAAFERRPYRRFDSVKANTSFVLGEFPWQVAAGDLAQVDDYISPPYMLSSETTGGEVTWSRGEYWTGAQIWQAFQLPGAPPRASGIFANQPSRFTGKVRSAWGTWLWLMVALAALAFCFTIFSARKEVFQQHYTYIAGTGTEPSFVTPVFDLSGRTSNVELRIQTNLDNQWAYFNLALINEQSGQAFDFGREVSYYTSGGETEGSRNDRVVIPSVPPGRYYLRVEPEMNPTPPVTLSYALTMRRDVPNYSFFWIGAALLLIPPIVTSIRAASFESARWRGGDA